MKKLTGIEKAALAFGLVLAIVGLISVVLPTEQVLVHPGSENLGVSYHSYVESITRGEARVYGAIAAFVGMVIVWLAFYRGAKDE